MYIPDNQRIAIFQGGKPVGMVEGNLYKPSMFGGNISMLSWDGTFLGEEIHEQSPTAVYIRAREIAKSKGLRQVQLVDGTDIDTLYTPALEE